MFPQGMLIWVSLPYATYGLVVDGGRVVAAPPIAAWMLGRTEVHVAGWLRARGARVVPLDPPL